METDALWRRAGRLHQLADGFEECGDFVVVLAEAFFEFEEFESELVLRTEDFAELDECADDLNAGLDSDGAVENGGEHDGAVFGKSASFLAGVSAREGTALIRRGVSRSVCGF